MASSPSLSFRDWQPSRLFPPRETTSGALKKNPQGVFSAWNLFFLRRNFHVHTFFVYFGRPQISEGFTMGFSRLPAFVRALPPRATVSFVKERGVESYVQRIDFSALASPGDFVEDGFLQSSFLLRPVPFGNPDIVWNFFFSGLTFSRLLGQLFDSSPVTVDIDLHKR